jgi:hypothetical protein
MLGAARRQEERGATALDPDSEAAYCAIATYVASDDPSADDRRGALRTAARAYAKSHNPELDTLTDLLEDALGVFGRLSNNGVLPRGMKRVEADFITWLVEDFKLEA